MATQLKEGDTVQVVDREVTANDEKTQTFFNHYRNLQGVLEKLYDDGMATVIVAVETLPEEIRVRHANLTDTAKNKWLDSLSNEARNKLTADEKQFYMRYSILLAAQDLIRLGGKPPKAKITEPTESEAAKAAAVTAADLAKAEEEHLKALQAQKEA
ncbi:MAG: hypothetical protein WCL39_09570 [Armatimonadota bacterium]